MTPQSKIPSKRSPAQKHTKSSTDKLITSSCSSALQTRAAAAPAPRQKFSPTCPPPHRPTSWCAVEPGTRSAPPTAHQTATTSLLLLRTTLGTLTQAHLSRAQAHAPCRAQASPVLSRRRRKPTKHPPFTLPRTQTCPPPQTPNPSLLRRRHTHAKQPLFALPRSAGLSIVPCAARLEGWNLFPDPMQPLQAHRAEQRLITASAASCPPTCMHPSAWTRSAASTSLLAHRRPHQRKCIQLRGPTATPRYKR